MSNSKDIQSKAEDFKKEGLYYLSALQYSLLFNYVNERNKNQTLNPEYIFNQNEIKNIFDNLLREYEKTIKILSFGKTWNEDELLLVFTFLMNFKLLKDYFTNYSMQWKLGVSELYELLKGITSQHENKKNAIKATMTIRRNRKDLSQEWLDQVLKF